MAIGQALANTPVATPAQQGQTSAGVDQPGLADKWRSWVNKPENAAALLQTGISLLQPLQIGQNTLGAIGSSIGQGFEARDRVLANQRSQAQLGTENQMKQQELNINQENADSAAGYKKSVGLSQLLKAKNFRAPINKAKSWEEYSQAALQAKRAGAAGIGQTYVPPTDDELKQLYSEWQATQETPGVGAASPSVGQPSEIPAPDGLPAGAKQAPDGNYYIPDPNRPGKFLRVD